MLHVQAGAKRRAGAGQDDHSTIANRGFFERLGQLVDQQRAERVALFRPVHGNGLDAIV